METVIMTKVLLFSLLILLIADSVASAKDRDDFPGRRQGGGTWNSELIPVPVPVKVD